MDASDATFGADGGSDEDARPLQLAASQVKATSGGIEGEEEDGDEDMMDISTIQSFAE
jgi:hypothetical protein